MSRTISALTPQQMEELYVWLDQRHPQPIDAQLKADLDARRIDKRINRALADCGASTTQPLSAGVIIHRENADFWNDYRALPPTSAHG